MSKQFFLVGYDLRVPRHEDALAAGIEACSTKHAKIAWGPWFLESELSAAAIRDHLRDRLTAADPDHVFNDKLLVVPLGKSPQVAVKTEGARSKSFDATRKLFPASARAAGTKPEIGRILALTYTLRDADPKQNREVRRAIWKSFPDCTKPVRALWFVHTNKTPGEVATEMREVLHRQGLSQGFGLMAVEVKRIELATPEHVRRDSFWLWEHGIKAEHTLLETSTPRAA